MAHVFVSYVRDNYGEVERLCKQLSARGVNVWLDRKAILPGQRWKEAIRKAIKDGAFFLACFSSEYAERASSYMNEELVLAIEELRQRPTTRAWFVPVLLSKCEVPDRSIGAGESLRDLQWVDLSEDWESGLERIAATLRPKQAQRRDIPVSSEVASEALRYYKDSITNYGGYPDYGFKLKQLKQVDDQIHNLRTGLPPLRLGSMSDKLFVNAQNHYRIRGYESVVLPFNQVDAKLSEGYELGLDPNSGREVWLVFQAGSILEENVLLVRPLVQE